MHIYLWRQTCALLLLHALPWSIISYYAPPLRIKFLSKTRRATLQTACWAWLNMAGTVKRFYDLSAKLLSGELLNFAALKGKVVLIENVASLWGTTVRDYTQMNELHSRYAQQGLVILGAPCNQFGHQVRPLRFLTFNFKENVSCTI